MKTPYKQDITDCITDEKTGNRLHRRHLESLYGDLDSHLRTLKTETLPVLDLPYRTGDLAAIKETSDYLRANFKRVVLLGTGGSSLGSRALSEMSAARRSDLRLDIITNVDPFFFNAFTASLPDETAWVVVSKSGSTVETIMQFLSAMPLIKGDISKKAVVITESESSPLGQLAKLHKIPILPHDPEIGGRYSVLSVVGILPAMLMGLSAEALREGAAFIVDILRKGTTAEAFAPAQGAAVACGLNTHNGISSNVMLAYSDRLGSLSRWYRQLWAESIGKEGFGTTPIYAMGPVDQHSQLQLWLEGPRDKFFTLMSAPFAESPVLQEGLIDGITGIEYLRNRSLSDLMAASKDATAQVLSSAGLPLRRIDLEQLNEFNIGALMMHFMLETILAARLMDVNPFDQPAVEDCKIRIRGILKGV